MMLPRLATVWALVLASAGCSGERTVAGAAPAAGAPATTVATPVVAPTRAEPPAPPIPSAPPAAERAGLDAARRYTAMFYRGELDLLHAEFSAEMRREVPLERLSAIHEHAITSYGKEVKVVREDAQTREDYRAFARFATFDKTDEIIEVQWILRGPSDEIAGFFIRPARRGVRAVGETGAP